MIKFLLSNYLKREKRKQELATDPPQYHLLELRGRHRQTQTKIYTKKV